MNGSNVPIKVIHLKFVLQFTFICCRSGRPSLRPEQVRDGLPQHRVPGVCCRGGEVLGHSGGLGYPGSFETTTHESPAVLRRPEGAGRQAVHPLVPPVRAPSTLRSRRTPIQLPGHLRVIGELVLRHVSRVVSVLTPCQCCHHLLLYISTHPPHHRHIGVPPTLPSAAPPAPSPVLSCTPSSHIPPPTPSAEFLQSPAELARVLPDEAVQAVGS